MADQMIGNLQGIACASVGSGQERSNTTGHADGDPRSTSLIDLNLWQVSSMRARLAALDATYYTTARLNTMTMNDLMYAIRVADYPTSIK